MEIQCCQPSPLSQHRHKNSDPNSSSTPSIPMMDQRMTSSGRQTSLEPLNQLPTWVPSAAPCSKTNAALKPFPTSPRALNHSQPSLLHWALPSTMNPTVSLASVSLMLLSMALSLLMTWMSLSQPATPVFPVTQSPSQSRWTRMERLICPLNHLWKKP